MLRGSAERSGWQERGAQGRVEPPAETQRGARSAGHRALLLVTLLILTDRWQLLHQAPVTFPVHLRDREFECSHTEMIWAMTPVVTHSNSCIRLTVLGNLVQWHGCTSGWQENTRAGTVWCTEHSAHTTPPEHTPSSNRVLMGHKVSKPH